MKTNHKPFLTSNTLAALSDLLDTEAETAPEAQRPEEKAERVLKLIHTVEHDPRHDFLRHVINCLKHVTSLEAELEALDSIGESDYRTMQPMIEKARTSLLELNATFQRRVYRRPYADRNLKGMAYQGSPRRY